MKDLIYRKIDKNNIELASKIQYKIFPFASAYKSYLEYLHQEAKLPIYYLIYYKGIPIGTVGFYELSEYSDTIWLNWFGIIEEYRNRGLGKKILFDAIDMAREYNKKWLRLFTYEVWNSTAQPLYKKYMQKEEYYINDKDNQEDIIIGKCKIFGYSLCEEEIDYWDNKFINIGKDDKEATISVKLMKMRGII